MGLREAFKRQKEGFKEVGKRVKKTVPSKSKKFFKFKSKGIKNPYEGLTQPYGYKPKVKTKTKRRRKKKK